MSGEEIGSLILTIAFFMVLDIGLWTGAFFASRRGFAGYLKSAHHTKWIELVPEEDRLGPISLKLDASQAVRKFRKDSHEDLGDRQIRELRRRANLLEELAVIGFLCMLAWALIVMVLIAVAD